LTNKPFHDNLKM